jgi:hypothetical protein
LTQAHPNAEPAAESAEFAGAHGLFWERQASGADGTRDALSFLLSVRFFLVGAAAVMRVGGRPLGRKLFDGRWQYLRKIEAIWRR